jgi:hypothetical protein
MRIDEHLPLLEDILGPWKGAIGRDYPGYRNHVYRMVHFCFALPECVPDWNDDARRKVTIAGCFHDLGIWSDRTFDYLRPSMVRAAAYLKEHALDAWTPEVELMIASHHKLRRFSDDRYPLVEAFRRADLIDVSLGLFKFGLPGAYVREVKRRFPNHGFHKRLLQLAGGWAPRHPTSPLPFLKW